MFLKIVVLVTFYSIKIGHALNFVFGVKGKGMNIGTITRTISKDSDIQKSLTLETPTVPDCSLLSFVKVYLHTKGEKEFRFKSKAPRVYFAYNSDDLLGLISLDFYERLDVDAEYEVNLEAIMDLCNNVKKPDTKRTTTGPLAPENNNAPPVSNSPMLVVEPKGRPSTNTLNISTESHLNSTPVTLSDSRPPSPTETPPIGTSDLVMKSTFTTAPVKFLANLQPNSTESSLTGTSDITTEILLTAIPNSPPPSLEHAVTPTFEVTAAPIAQFEGDMSDFDTDEAE